MRAISLQPHLRLVHDAPHDRPVDAEATMSERAARRRVAEENVAAAHHGGLDPCDPRWRLAAETSSMLDGAALPPEQREQVLRRARSLGVRLFDANLIIAIVQDAARRGEPLAGPAGTLAIVPAPSAERRGAPWPRAVAAVAAAVLVNLLLIAWLLRG